MTGSAQRAQRMSRRARLSTTTSPPQSVQSPSLQLLAARELVHEQHRVLEGDLRGGHSVRYASNAWHSRSPRATPGQRMVRIDHDSRRHHAEQAEQAREHRGLLLNARRAHEEARLPGRLAAMPGTWLGASSR